MDFDVRFKLAQRSDVNLTGAFNDQPTEAFEHWFEESRSKNLNEVLKITQNSDGTYQSKRDPELETEPKSTEHQAKKKLENKPEKTAAIPEETTKKKEQKTNVLPYGMPMLYYQIQAMQTPNQDSSAFVRFLVSKAVVEVKKNAEGVQFHFSFDKQQMPLEISIRKEGDQIQVILHAKETLYNELKKDLSRLVAYLNQQHQDDSIDVVLEPLSEQSSSDASNAQDQGHETPDEDADSHDQDAESLEMKRK